MYAAFGFACYSVELGCLIECCLDYGCSWFAGLACMLRLWVSVSRVCRVIRFVFGSGLWFVVRFVVWVLRCVGFMGLYGWLLLQAF